MANNVQEQSQELATKLWAIANDLRNNMDASKFKDYILGVIFYRYLSERTENYMDSLLKDDGLTYKEALESEEFAPIVEGWSIDYLGYIIKPEYLWSSLIEEIKGGKFTIERFEKAVSELVASTIGQESESAFDGLFSDMDLQNKDLGKEVSERTELISKIMLRIDDISFNVNDANMDVLGTAYMILISNFQSDAGKKGGEFFTPNCVSKLLAQLATVGLEEAKNVSDSCAGSGSLLLEVQNCLPSNEVGHYYATEKNSSNYNLLRMNLLMHGVPYKQFTCYNDDSVAHDNYYENGNPIMFDVQVENPPYSSKWDASAQLLDDPRYSSCGVLAPKSYEDLMFVESMMYHMAEDGRIAVLVPHGVLFRGGSEKAIREYMIKGMNRLDAVIGLPKNMFHGTSIPVALLVLKAKRNGDSGNVLFIDASNEFKPGKNQNTMEDEHIEKIVETYKKRVDVDKFAHVATISEIEGNDFNLNIPRYVDTFEEEEPIDISEVKAEIKQITDDEQKAIDKLNTFLKELGV